MDQIIIKIVLITAFFLFTAVLLRPGGSARTQAIRTIVLLLALTAGIGAVIFPGIVNDLARMVGVGRGTDLVLYAFIVVFMGNALSTARNRRKQDVQTTQLARTMALQHPLYPDDQTPS